MSEVSAVAENVEVEAEQTEATEESKFLQFVRAWQTSENTEEVSEKTGKTVATCSAYASKLRQDEYRMQDKTDKDGNTVFKSNVEGEDETTDKSKAQVHGGNGPQAGKPKVVRIFQRNKAGEKILKRRGIPLKKMPKGGGTTLDTDAAMALIAELSGESEG